MFGTLTKFDQQVAPAVVIERTESQAIAVFWGVLIPAIPDLVSLEQSRSGKTYETALSQLLQVQQNWIRQLHGEERFTLSLRIISKGDASQPLTFGLVGKTQGQNEAETIQAARNFFNKVKDTFPNGYPFQPCQEPQALAHLRLPFLPTESLAELRRSITPLQTISHAELPNQTGQVIYPWNTQADTFQAIFRALVNHPAEAAIAINIRPTHLTQPESNYMAQQAHCYAKIASISRTESEQNRVLSTSTQVQDKLLEAEEAAKGWSERLSSWRSPFEMTVSVISESPLPQSAVAALQSAVEGDSEATSRGKAELVTAKSEAQKIAVRQNWADLTLHRWANRHHLERLPWIFSAEEVHSVFRLPIADRSGVWGLPSAVGAGDARRPMTETSVAAEIAIGSLHLSKKHLTQHVLISGVPGSGKTNTSLYLLETLWREHQIPWMVLEPAKTEYRGLQSVNSLQDDLLIFTLGDERTAPFRFNPFELPEGINLDSHIGALLDLFSVSMSMWGPLPNVVEQLVIEAYRRKGFTLLGDNSELLPPTFSDMNALVAEIVPKLGYKKESTDEISAAISVRLNKFCRGALGRMLNTTKSVPFDFVMQRPVILEMSQITNTDDRAFVMGLILNRCYQYWTARRHKATGELKHLLLVEEAHNLLGDVSESTSQEQANPKGKAVRNFANMLAEVRGFGQGIAIAEQNPEGLVSDVMVNTNLKLAHRVVEASNREVLGRSMLLTPQQEQRLAALKTGQMLYYLGGQSEPSMTTAPNFKDADNGFDSKVIDAAIHQQFQRSVKVNHANIYEPLAGCVKDPALSFCIEQGEDLVKMLSEDARYREVKKNILSKMLAVPFGASATDEAYALLSRLLLTRGIGQTSTEHIQTTLNSALSLLAYEAASEKGKVHGWLGEQVSLAHRLLIQSLQGHSVEVQTQWLELCQIPPELVQLGLPHPDYAKCVFPGAFRYENKILMESDYTVLKTEAAKPDNSLPTAMRNWAATQYIFDYLSEPLRISFCNCLAIEFVEKDYDDLPNFWQS